MSNCIVFDLDDTLINTHPRHYHVVGDYINQFLPRLRGEWPELTKYLKYRRGDGLNNIELLNKLYPGQIKEDAFMQFFLKNIESYNYLKYDQAIVNDQLLSALKTKHNLRFHLLSLRSNAETAMTQFKEFPFSSYFDEAVFIPHGRHDLKGDFFHNLSETKVTMFIGDTLSDLEAARANEISFLGVQTGLYPLKEAKFKNINAVLDYLIKKNNI